MKEVVELLTKNKETISTMESCTGGYIANAITNIEGASEILKFSAIAYSNLSSDFCLLTCSDIDCICISL